METELRYGKEIQEFFDFLKEDWVTDEEHAQVIRAVMSKLKITEKDIDNMLRVGVKNGSSVETQFDVIKKVISMGNFE